MALGFKTSGESSSGNFLPIVKYDAKAGRFFRVDREQGADGWSSNIVDITQTFKAVFDFDNIEVGWINFPPGSAPDFRMVAIGQDAGPRPSDQHKEGFRILVKLGKECGGDVREFSSSAKVVRNAMDALHDEILAGAAANKGKLAVVALNGTTPITTGQGAKKSTNYAPDFVIAGWVARPVDLTAQPRGGVVAPATVPAQTPAATGSTKAAPPATKAPAMADAEDFG